MSTGVVAHDPTSPTPDVQTPNTGIKNADEIITLALAYGLTVTVETTVRKDITSYLVRFAIPVPTAYAATELGRAIAADTLSMLWTKQNRKGTRGRLEEAAVQGAASSSKLRTVRELAAAVENQGRRSNKYARDAAPFPDDVVDVLHAVFLDGRQVHPGISAAHVRTIVKNRRFKGHLVHQDSDKAICIDNRRYAPVTVLGPTPNDVVDAPYAVYDSHNDRHKDITAADVRHMITLRREAGYSSDQSDDGTITAAGIRFVPQLAAGKRQHVRTVNGGTPVGVSTRDALVPRPAAEVLAADPIPAGVSVLEGMPGREIAREELRTPSGVLAHTDYVVQLRDVDCWILPNHDDQADITRRGVATVQRRVLDNGPGRARTSLDTDGTVYVSDGRQAARYIPAALIADYSADRCPGCDTPYATNGDGPCTGGRSVPTEAHQAHEVKARARAVKFAGEWWAAQHTEEPTDEALHAAFANCGKPPRLELYPAIREAIAAEMPPAAAAPLFAALAAYEAVRDASLSESPRDLHTVACHLETLPLAAPVGLHPKLRAARDAAEEAWEGLRTVEGRTSRAAARDKARAAIERARAAILAVEPRAEQMRGTYVPATAEDIRAATRAYLATLGTPEELAAIETGTPSIRVDCCPTLPTGKQVFVRITAGVDSPMGRIPAHPPVTQHTPRLDGRLNAEDNARKALHHLFRVDVPVQYAGLRRV